jgi:pimeloyl-ACP methyl ester carboxylesterase
VDYSEQIIEAPDGRILEIATCGDSKKPTVFFHHGSPGAVATMKLMASLCERADICLVTMSRAGYGKSSRREGRSVASIVDDARAVLDALGRTTYVSLGWSGGGPHSLACAALDTPRCVAGVTLAGVAPMDVDLDWTEGMGRENIDEFALARVGGANYEAHMVEVAAQLGAATADNIIDLFSGLLSDVDVTALARCDIREQFAEATRLAFERGWSGYYDDDRAFFSPWGFDPTEILAPVHVWYGDEDLMVPPTHGKWLASHLPTARSHHFSSEGHLSLYLNHLNELAASLAELSAIGLR